MADVGRSTAAHVSSPRRATRNTERWLVNWGNWTASLPAERALDIPGSPTFREYVAGYKVTGESRYPEDADAAEGMDMLIAGMEERPKACLVCHYVLKRSSRDAARLLTLVESKDHPGEIRRRGQVLRCTHETYLRWLDAAIDDVEKVIDSLTI